MIDQEKVDKLTKFKQRNKFSKRAWNDRGLNPSSGDICRNLTGVFNSCADKLIDGVNNQLSDEQIKHLLEKELTSLNKLDFDTEEREFICDLYYELASIVCIDISEVLEIWLYGFISKARQEKTIDTISQPYAKCGIESENHRKEKQERIGITSASPGYLKVSEINNDLYGFSQVIDKKYSQIDFTFLFYFVIGYRAVVDEKSPDIPYVDDDIKYYAKEKMLGMDIVMPHDEFEPYKKNVSMQRRLMGNYFFPLFSFCIRKYRNKLSALKLIEKELVEDMRLFLVENLWLPDENGQYKLSVIETVSYERAMSLLGNPDIKKFANNKQGQKVQDLTWTIDEQTELSSMYLLVDKKWELQKYEIRTANNT